MDILGSEGIASKGPTTAICNQRLLVSLNKPNQLHFPRSKNKQHTSEVSMKLWENLIIIHSKTPIFLESMASRKINYETETVKLFWGGLQAEICPMEMRCQMTSNPLTSICPYITFHPSTYPPPSPKKNDEHKKTTNTKIWKPIHR